MEVPKIKVWKVPQTSQRWRGRILYPWHNKFSRKWIINLVLTKFSAHTIFACLPTRPSQAPETSAYFMIFYQVCMSSNVVLLSTPSPPLTAYILKFIVDFVKNPWKGMENHVKKNYAQLGYVCQYPSLQYFRYTLNRVLSEVKFTHKACHNLRVHAQHSANRVRCRHKSLVFYFFFF